MLLQACATLLALTSAGAAEWRTTTSPVPEPAREFRAAWVTSVYNLDWPSQPGLPKEQQQAELGKMLDAAAALGLNAVLLQIRPGGDALYASRLEPWSAVLTGTPGGDPGYDPLAYAVKEAHQRGLELHAWCNPFRAKVGKAEPAPQHWMARHPEWVRGKEGHLFMDPGLPEVRDHVLAVFRDIVRRYEIDGIHIDDYFYPYPVFGPGAVRLEVPLGDESLWEKARAGKALTLADWRRDNINRFVRAFYETTKAEKPTVRVGISPFGIWQPGVPAGIEARVNAYDHLYGDSRRWLQEGWCDYLAPQLYWPIQPARQSFTSLMEWWQAQSKGRPVWPGMAVDRVASTTEPMLPLTELNDQLAVMRRVAPVPGALLWRMKFLTGNGRGVATLLQEQSYAERALPPAARWLKGVAPAKPAGKVETTNGATRLTWSGSTGAAVRWWVVQVRKGVKWELMPPLFCDQKALTLTSEMEAVALRAMGGNGLTSAPVVWSRNRR